MPRISLTQRQRQFLHTQFKNASKPSVHQRVLSLLALEKGFPVSEIAQILDVSRATIYNWVDRYHENPLSSGLFHRPGQGRPSLWTEELHSLLLLALKHPPQELGYAGSNWSIPILQECLFHLSGTKVSEHTLRRQLHSCGYVWKRYRYHLAPDPDESKKNEES